MINVSYVPAEFAEDIATNMLKDNQEDLAEFMSNSLGLNLYFDFSTALEVIGIKCLEDAFVYGNDHGGEISLADSFFKAEDGVVTSANRVDELYPARDIRGEIVRAFVQDCCFEGSNEILKKYCYRYNIAKIGGAIYSFKSLESGTVIILVKMLADANCDEEYITDMLDDFKIAYIKD